MGCGGSKPDGGVATASSRPTSPPPSPSKPPPQSSASSTSVRPKEPPMEAARTPSPAHDAEKLNTSSPASAGAEPGPGPAQGPGGSGASGSTRSASASARSGVAPANKSHSAAGPREAANGNRPLPPRGGGAASSARRLPQPQPQQSSSNVSARRMAQQPHRQSSTKRTTQQTQQSSPDSSVRRMPQQQQQQKPQGPQSSASGRMLPPSPPRTQSVRGHQRRSPQLMPKPPQGAAPAAGGAAKAEEEEEEEEAFHDAAPVADDEDRKDPSSGGGGGVAESARLAPAFPAGPYARGAPTEANVAADAVTVSSTAGDDGASAAASSVGIRRGNVNSAAASGRSLASRKSRGTARPLRPYSKDGDERTRACISSETAIDAAHSSGDTKSDPEMESYPSPQPSTDEAADGANALAEAEGEPASLSSPPSPSPRRFLPSEALRRSSADSDDLDDARSGFLTAATTGSQLSTPSSAEPRDAKDAEQKQLAPDLLTSFYPSREKASPRGGKEDKPPSSVSDDGSKQVGSMAQQQQSSKTQRTQGNRSTEVRGSELADEVGELAPYENERPVAVLVRRGSGRSLVSEMTGVTNGTVKTTKTGKSAGVVSWADRGALAEGFDEAEEEGEVSPPSHLVRTTVPARRRSTASSPKGRRSSDDSAVISTGGAFGSVATNVASVGGDYGSVAGDAGEASAFNPVPDLGTEMSNGVNVQSSRDAPTVTSEISAVSSLALSAWKDRLSSTESASYDSAAAIAAALAAAKKSASKQPTTKHQLAKYSIHSRLAAASVTESVGVGSNCPPPSQLINALRAGTERRSDRRPAGPSREAFDARAEDLLGAIGADIERETSARQLEISASGRQLDVSLHQYAEEEESTAPIPDAEERGGAGVSRRRLRLQNRLPVRDVEVRLTSDSGSVAGNTIISDMADSTATEWKRNQRAVLSVGGRRPDGGDDGES